MPQVDDIPFAMAGQGQQAIIKIALAMSRTVGASTFISVEEPENHLSDTSLTRLISRIGDLAAVDQQLFVATHSSYVANRLGLDKLLLLHAGKPAKLSELTPETMAHRCDPWRSERWAWLRDQKLSAQELLDRGIGSVAEFGRDDLLRPGQLATFVALLLYLVLPAAPRLARDGPCR